MNHNDNDNDVDPKVDCSTAVPRAETEYVIILPNRLTKVGYQVLIENQWVARPWHLEGRYGSRTHKFNPQCCGIPILPLSLLTGMPQTDALKQLLLIEMVEIVERPITISNRIPPNSKHVIDATMHPERCPTRRQRNKIRKFTFIELFSGIGGFGLALEALGGNCVLASELDDTCRAVYSENMRVQPVLYGDVYQIPDSAFPSVDDNIDLLVGGFPCQPFSSLGTQPGLDDQVKGQLYLQIVRALKLCKPKGFLLENVPGLLRMTEAFETIVKALEEAGYVVSTQLCSSRGLTATSRKRLFFVGVRLDCSNDNDLFEFPFIPDLSLRAVDVIDYCDKTDGDLLRLLSVSDAQMDQLKNRSKLWKPAKLAWPDVTIDTLDSHYGVAVGRGNSQLVPQSAPKHPRRFSPLECARIMGFPAETFAFPTPSPGQGDMAFIKAQYRMFGNAVCPPLVAAIAGAVVGHCRPSYRDEWIEHGRAVALELAVSAVLPERRNLIWMRLRNELPHLFNTQQLPP